MFEVKMGNSATMKKIVDAMKDLLNEANFDCTTTSISLQAMDPSHVALVSLRLESEGFETYRCDRNTNIGISMSNFSKIMKCAGNDDTVAIQYQGNGDNMCIQFENPTKDRVSEYQLRLMDLDSDRLEIPYQNYECTVKIPSAEFQRICRDLGQFGDALHVTATKAGIEFSAKGDMGAGKVQFSQTASADDEGRKVEIELKEAVSMSFAVKYLSLFTKATPLSPMVTIVLSKDMPIVVEYPISLHAGVEDEEEDEDKSKEKNVEMEEIGYIKYYLAPKIDDGDNDAGTN